MSEKGSPHVSYTAGFKLKVVLFTKQNGNSAAGRSFSVNEKCLWGDGGHRRRTSRKCLAVNEPGGEKCPIS